MAHEKKLLVDVFQAYFYRKDATGKRDLVFMSENLTSGGIVSSQENTDVRNGQGNGLFAILPGQKDVTVNLTENVFSFEALELNSAATKKTREAATGNTGLILKRGGRFTSDIDSNQTIGTVSNLTKIRLKQVPQNMKDLEIYVGDRKMELANALADVNADNKFCFVKKTTLWDGVNPTASDEIYIVVQDAVGNTLKATTDLKIMPYIYVTKDTDTQTLTIDAKTFAEGGELWLQTIEKDAKQKATAYVYFVFENAMPEGNFEINTVSEVQPNDMTVNMRVLPNEDGELYRIVREEITQ